MTFARQTVNEIILARLNDPPEKVQSYAELPGGGFRPVTCGEDRRTTIHLAAALHGRGLGDGQPVAILAGVRHEWVQWDFANLLTRLVTIGIYPTSTSDQILYLLQHSESRVLVVENDAQLRSLSEVLPQCPLLQFIVRLDDSQAEAAETTIETLSMAAFLEEGARAIASGGEAAVIERAHSAEPDDIATLVYTSGTTGPPKGAMLTHRNLFHVTETVAGIMDFTAADRSVVYLPLAHVLQRYSVYLGCRIGITGYYSSRLDDLARVIQEVRPTVFVGVPRVFEKIHARAVATAESMSPLRQRIFARAFAVGHEFAQLRRNGGKPGLWLRLQQTLFDRLVFAKVRAKLGNHVRMAVSGGAPLALQIALWFEAAGILVVEGYGLTETSAPATTCTPTAYKHGTVGRAIPDTDVRIATDGEIEVRGPGVFQGYFKDEAATAEAFSEDGFFKTGDIGELDAQGFLKITDRKKDLIITAGGKNVAPANIENLLKEHPLIGQAMVYGDRRPYLVGAISLDPDEALSWAQRHGAAGSNLEELSQDPVVCAAIDQHVKATNTQLAPFESLKKWLVVGVPFVPENGYLTPTLKLRRRVIVQHFGAELDALYDSETPAAGP